MATSGLLMATPRGLPLPASGLLMATPRGLPYQGIARMPGTLLGCCWWILGQNMFEQLTWKNTEIE